MGHPGGPVAFDYTDLVRRHVGRDPVAKDGVSDAAIRRREKQLGVRLPASLRAYYRAAGNLAELNQAHNLLYDLPQLVIEDGYLQLPTTPGWGTEVNEAGVKAHPPRRIG